MTEIRVYHLSITPLEKALPGILQKILERDMRAVVLTESGDRVSDLNAKLWTYAQQSFLPHGAAADGFAADQPIWLTEKDGDNPNGAKVLVLVDEIHSQHISNYELACIFLTPTQSDSPSWHKQEKAWEAEHQLMHFKQDPTGKWQKG